MNKSVKNVDTFIQDRKVKKQTELIRLWTRRLILISLNAIVLGLVYILMNEPNSRSESSVVEGNYYLSKQAVLTSAQLNDERLSMFLYVEDIHDNLINDPLIKSSTIKIVNNRKFNIKIVEKKVVGIVQNIEIDPSLLLEDGTLVKLNADLLHKTLSMPIIYDFNETSDLVNIGQAMAQLDNEILVIISEIHLRDKRFNETYLIIHMQDGNRVFIPVSALKALKNYYIMMQEYPMTNICIYIDGADTNPYQAECIE